MGVTSRSVAIGAGIIAVGAPYHGAAGAVFVSEEKTGKHLYTLPGTAHTGAGLFGWSVAISRNTLVVGAPFTNSTGAVFIYDLRTRRHLQTIQTTDFLPGGNWGYSVAIDGEWIAIGAPYGDGTGAVEMWRLGATSRLHRINTAGLHYHPAARFGQAVALQNGILAVGAPGDSPFAFGATAGRVFVFDAEANSVLFAGRSTTAVSGEEFGFAVAMSGNHLVVGAPNPVSAFSLGTVAVYYLDDLFSGYASYTGEKGLGRSVAVDQGFIALGSDSGVQLVRQQRRRLGYPVSIPAVERPYPRAILADDGFGAAVAIRGSTLISTAPGDDSVYSDGGAFWKFSPVLPPDYAIAARYTTGDSMPGTGSSLLSEIDSAVPIIDYDPLVLGRLSGGDSLGERSTAVWGWRDFPFSATNKLAQGGYTFEPQQRWTKITQALGAGSSYWLRGTIAGSGIGTANNEIIRKYDRFDFTGNSVLQTDGFLGTGAIRKFSGSARINTLGDTLAVPVTYSPTKGLVRATPASDTGTVVVEPAGLVAEFREGFSYAPGGVFKLGQMSPRFAFQEGNLAFTHFLQGAPPASNQMIQWLGVEQARTGFPAQTGGTPLSNYTSFTGETGNGAYCVFRATLARSATAGITTRNNEGLFSNRSGNPARLVLQKGDLVFSSGSAPNGTISRFLEFGIASNGDIVALVTLVGRGINRGNDVALLLAKAGAGGGVEVLLREGDAAPSCHGARIGTILKVDFTGNSLPDKNYYAVIASLVTEPGGATTSDNLIVLRGNTLQGTALQTAIRRPYLVLRKGQTELSPSGALSHTSFDLPCVVRDGSGALNAGLGHMVEYYRGTLLVKATLSSRQRRLFHVE